MNHLLSIFNIAGDTPSTYLFEKYPEALTIFTILFLINLIAFAVYVFDKHLAVGHFSRVPEVVLHTLTIIGGAYGAGMAMLLCRHKTRHPAFQILVPTFFLIWTAVIVYLFVFKFKV